MIVGQIGAGRSVDDLLAEYPYLEREDILQALRYARVASWRTWGPLFDKANVEPQFLDDAGMRGPHRPPAQYAPVDWLNYNRHGSFFDLRGQSYFACNDQSGPGQSPLFRNSVLCYAHYRTDGTIEPLKLTAMGVGRHDARLGIPAIEYSGIENGRKDWAENMPSIVLHQDGRLEFDRVSGLGGTMSLYGTSASAGSSIDVLIDGHRVDTQMNADRADVALRSVNKAARLTLITRKGTVRLTKSVSSWLTNSDGAVDRLRDG
jgi:hypothetical protein